MFLLNYIPKTAVAMSLFLFIQGLCVCLASLLAEPFCVNLTVDSVTLLHCIYVHY